MLKAYSTLNHQVKSDHWLSAYKALISQTISQVHQPSVGPLHTKRHCYGGICLEVCAQQDSILGGTETQGSARSTLTSQSSHQSKRKSARLSTCTRSPTMGSALTTDV